MSRLQTNVLTMRLPDPGPLTVSAAWSLAVDGHPDLQLDCAVRTVPRLVTQLLPGRLNTRQTGGSRAVRVAPAIRFLNVPDGNLVNFVRHKD